MAILGAVLAFAFDAGHVDRTAFGVVLLLLGGVAFVLSASRLWFYEHHERSYQLNRKGLGAGAVASYLLVVLGAVLVFAVRPGHIDRSVVGETLFVAGGLAFAMSARRLRFMDTHRHQPEPHSTTVSFVMLAVLSFALVTAGAVLAFAVGAASVAVGVVLLILGGMTFFASGGSLRSRDYELDRTDTADNGESTRDDGGGNGIGAEPAESATRPSPANERRPQAPVAKSR